MGTQNRQSQQSVAPQQGGIQTFGGLTKPMSTPSSTSSFATHGTQTNPFMRSTMSAPAQQMATTGMGMGLGMLGRRMPSMQPQTMTGGAQTMQAAVMPQVQTMQAAVMPQTRPMSNMPTYIDESNMDSFRGNEAVMSAYMNSGLMKSGARMDLNGIGGIGALPGAPATPQANPAMGGTGDYFAPVQMPGSVPATNNVGSNFNLNTPAPQSIPQYERWTPPPPPTPEEIAAKNRPWYSGVLPGQSQGTPMPYSNNWDN